VCDNLQVPPIKILPLFILFGFSDVYVSWFRSYLANRRSRVRVSGVLSLPLQVGSVVPQGCVLWPFLFNIFINYLCNSIKHCTFLIFADDLKIFRVINSPHDCFSLETDINFVSDWCAANSMGLNIAKTRVVSYFRKANVLRYEYQRCHASLQTPAVLRT
jgi:hypothetical protein